MLRLIADIALFILCGIAPIVGLIWIFAAGNKREKERKAAMQQSSADAAVNEQ